MTNFSVQCQRHEFAFRRSKIQHMCKAATRMMLQQHEMETMLDRQLVPQSTYGCRLSQFSTKQCHALDVIIMATFLFLLKINKSMPRVVVHGSIHLGETSITKFEALQDERGVHYFIQTLRWDQITANGVITTLNAYQLNSVFVTPVLETPNLPIDYLPVGLI